MSKVRFFDHLTPKVRSLFYEAKRFKKQHQCEFVGLRTLGRELRKNAESRAVKANAISDMWRLSGNE